MSFIGLIIGTAVLFALTYGITLPLARAISGSRGNRSTTLENTADQSNLEPSSISQSGVTMTPAGQTQTVKAGDAIDSVDTGTFIIVHVMVMGIAGFLLGAVAGIYFIGFARQAKMWPGMIALIVTSLIGSSM